MRLTFSVPGPVKGKGRPRATVTPGGHARLYTPAATADYENHIRGCYLRQFGRVMVEPPVVLEVVAQFAVPKSYSKKKAALCGQNIIRPTCKPDADNTLKAVADALNGIAYADDSAVVEMRVSKRYGPYPTLFVRITGEQAPQEEQIQEDT